MEALFVAVLVVLALVLASLKVINEYERAIVFRLGRVLAPKGPGLILVIPLIDRIVRVPLRIVALDVPKQDVITRDNVSVSINAVVYFHVADSQMAILKVQDYLYATGQIAQTTLRSVVGEADLDDLLAAREQIHGRLREIIDHQTDPWGIKVTQVELKDIDLPVEMKRAMAWQAEAERERRAKIISAEGELQASRTLAEAARIMETSPISIQLRYLQTLSEIATENNSTTIFPVPIDLLSAFTTRGRAPPPVSPTAGPAPEVAPPSPALAG